MVKSTLKVTRSEEFVEAIKEKEAGRILKEQTKEDQPLFRQWSICMDCCRDRGGVYIEGDNK